MLCQFNNEIFLSILDLQDAEDADVRQEGHGDVLVAESHVLFAFESAQLKVDHNVCVPANEAKDGKGLTHLCPAKCSRGSSG